MTLSPTARELLLYLDEVKPGWIGVLPFELSSGTAELDERGYVSRSTPMGVPALSITPAGREAASALRDV